MNSGRLVSVVLPAKDAASTIIRAVGSVLAQDYAPMEVIVVDDGSQDTTADLMAGLADPRLRVLNLPQSRGAAAARNVGIKAAEGGIVAFQDADDEWLPGKLRQQVELLLSDPKLVFVACGARFISPYGEDLGPLYGGAIPQAGPRAWPALLARNTVAAPTVVAWREALLAEGGFNESLPVGEDQDMWIRLAIRGCLGYIDAPLVRVHGTFGSLSGVGSELSYRQQLEFTLPMVNRHVAANKAALSQREVRHILGERWGRLGRTAYSYGSYRDGLRMLVRATLLGFEPLASVRHLLNGSPPARWLKRQLRIGTNLRTWPR